MLKTTLRNGGFGSLFGDERNGKVAEGSLGGLKPHSYEMLESGLLPAGKFYDPYPWGSGGGRLMDGCILSPDRRGYV